MEKIIAEGLLSIGAVFLRPEEPFTWASGIKSPIYCDNRLILTAPAVRNTVEASIAETVKKNFPTCEVLMGTSTAGIAHAGIAAHIMGIPMGYVRAGNKEHGRQNRIEGRLEKGQKVVVIEDLISTGMSSLQAVEAIRQVPAQVVGVLAIFQYGMPKATEAFEKAGCPFYTLTDFKTIIQVAAEKHIIEHDHLELLGSWSADPQAWSENYLRTH